MTLQPLTLPDITRHPVPSTRRDGGVSSPPRGLVTGEGTPGEEASSALCSRPLTDLTGVRNDSYTRGLVWGDC